MAALVIALVASGALAKERVVVLTDIANEPDDEESLVHLLVTVALSSTWIRRSLLR